VEIIVDEKQCMTSLRYRDSAFCCNGSIQPEGPSGYKAAGGRCDLEEKLCGFDMAPSGAMQVVEYLGQGVKQVPYCAKVESICSMLKPTN
jgi:hypothetical protein